ncbi:hypothetical protein [Methylorubrum aminovorans]
MMSEICSQSLFHGIMFVCFVVCTAAGCLIASYFLIISVKSKIKSSRNYSDPEILVLISRGGMSSFALRKVDFDELDRPVFDSARIKSYILSIVIMLLAIIFTYPVQAILGCDIRN